MSKPILTLDMFCVEMRSEDDPVVPRTKLSLALKSEHGGTPLELVVSEEQYVAIRVQFIRGVPLTLTLTAKERPRFDEEKPPTPAASRYEPEPDQ